MAFNLVADCVIKGKPYPPLTKWQAEPYTPAWREFGKHWPYIVPLELFEHCQTHNYPCSIAPHGDLYPIGLGFFNFKIDYFGLLNADILQSLKDNKLKILFYYHEGDNPYAIHQQLNSLCIIHNLPLDCYRFISGNTEADKIRGMVYFPDHELLYWHRNRNVAGVVLHLNQREKDFTVLSRTHKWWRATVMSDLHKQGLLNNSYWSYRTDIATDEPFTDNPIEIDSLDRVREHMDKFLLGAPYTCDSMDENQHNDHGLIESSHYTNSYCHIILETHFDADGSKGAFLTEKTFKVIKHGHPFVIAGCPGSLCALRKLGYKTFDHAIDNSYDDEMDNTKRWCKLVNTIKQIKQENLHSWFIKCSDDINYNQQLFTSSKYSRLNTLFERLND